MLNRTVWKNIYIVKPAGPCAGTTYKPLYQHIKSTYGSLVSTSSGNVTGFDEFLNLARANKFIADKFSTYSFWAGYFSIGSEVHVDIKNTPVLRDKKYVYHDEEHNKYFGRFCSDENSIVFPPQQDAQ